MVKEILFEPREMQKGCLDRHKDAACLGYYSETHVSLGLAFHTTCRRL